MNLQTTYDLFRELREDNICFIYRGYFSDDVTDMLINLSETNINTTSGLKKMRKKVSFLMAECFQNVVRHGDKAPEDIRPGDEPYLFVTRNIGNTYYISSANLIPSKNVAGLATKLKQVNELDADSLKALYMDVLANEAITDKGGAGLGLIEMARKSGSKLEFNFEPYNDSYHYFYLQIRHSDKDQEPDRAMDITTTLNFHRMVLEQNVIMVQKDNFSQDSIKPVLSMVEKNLQAQEQMLKVRKVAFHVLVEILQNLSKHSWMEDGIRNGIFVLGRQGENYLINTGNFVNQKQADKLKADLEQLLALDKDGLNKLYRKTLKEGKTTENRGAGLGLIDIARESNQQMAYSFHKEADDMYFFIFSVKL